ncbi:hypothetical protein KZZ52_54930 [Dactylosporangium sp. AC04546]|uniref:hypothetical protein n=1 Tax=Dactylosporangium sp. AC04546 TaxID=2862460 RepID=UPI001EE0E526|nr:hypothetical protein [Dactylosporangium sp. AC04546]WVK82934.1 hypothetical protein KZZ52_54930 [Dactylosporangium sp. AC04546]
MTSPDVEILRAVLDQWKSAVDAPTGEQAKPVRRIRNHQRQAAPTAKQGPLTLVTRDAHIHTYGVDFRAV